MYEKYHGNAYDPAEVEATVRRLYEDFYVKDKHGIYEYILGGCKAPQLLDVRIFDEAARRSRYAEQTKVAQEKGESNCPYCAMEVGNNRTRLWKLNEMDADHVTAWSKGGATDIENCQMLCKTHNRAKGNRCHRCRKRNWTPRYSHSISAVLKGMGLKRRPRNSASIVRRSATSSRKPGRMMAMNLPGCN